MGFTVAALLLPALFCAGAHGQIYRSTDAQGNTVYSDTPSPGSEAVELPQPNTTPAVEPSAIPRPRETDDDATVPAIRITQPSDGQIIANGRLPTTVRIDSDRPLGPAYQLSLSIDGSRQSLPATMPLEHSIPLLSRGAHTIEAVLKNADGDTVSRDSVDIIVRWPGS